MASSNLAGTSSTSFVLLSPYLINCSSLCPETRVKPTDEVITERCGKTPNHVLVYMFVPPSSENSKEILRTVAIEKELAEEVEIYNWKLIKGESHNKANQQWRSAWTPFQKLSKYQSLVLSNHRVIKAGKDH